MKTENEYRGNGANLGKTGVFLNPLYPSIHRKACQILSDWGTEDKDNSHRYGIMIAGEARRMAARECEVMV